MYSNKLEIKQYIKETWEEREGEHIKVNYFKLIKKF